MTGTGWSRGQIRLSQEDAGMGLEGMQASVDSIFNYSSRSSSHNFHAQFGRSPLDCLAYATATSSFDRQATALVRERPVLVSNLTCVVFFCSLAARRHSVRTIVTMHFAACFGIKYGRRPNCRQPNCRHSSQRERGNEEEPEARSVSQPRAFRVCAACLALCPARQL
jgi:hypothetical protein